MFDILENIWFLIISIFFTLLHRSPKEQKSEIFAPHSRFCRFSLFWTPSKGEQKYINDPKPYIF